MEIILDLPVGFPINKVISLYSWHLVVVALLRSDSTLASQLSLDVSLDRLCECLVFAAPHPLHSTCSRVLIFEDMYVYE